MITPLLEKPTWNSFQATNKHLIELREIHNNAHNKIQTTKLCKTKHTLEQI